MLFKSLFAAMLVAAAVQAAPAPAPAPEPNPSVTGGVGTILNGILAPLLPIIAAEAGGVIQITDAAGNIIGGISASVINNL